MADVVDTAWAAKAAVAAHIESSRKCRLVPNAMNITPDECRPD